MGQCRKKSSLVLVPRRREEGLAVGPARNTRRGKFGEQEHGSYLLKYVKNHMLNIMGMSSRIRMQDTLNTCS